MVSQGIALEAGIQYLCAVVSSSGAWSSTGTASIWLALQHCAGLRSQKQPHGFDLGPLHPHLRRSMVCHRLQGKVAHVCVGSILWPIMDERKAVAQAAETCGRGSADQRDSVNTASLQRQVHQPGLHLQKCGDSSCSPLDHASMSRKICVFNWSAQEWMAAQERGMNPEN